MDAALLIVIGGSAGSELAEMGGARLEPATICCRLSLGTTCGARLDRATSCLSLRPLDEVQEARSGHTRTLSAFEDAPSLDQGEGRAPSPRIGQLGLGLAA